jgi:hypothetical protein
MVSDCSHSAACHPCRAFFCAAVSWRRHAPLLTPSPRFARPQDNIGGLERQLSDLVEDEKTLEGKLAKKKQELARAQKRLESLSTVRPAFMDEYEKVRPLTPCPSYPLPARTHASQTGARLADWCSQRPLFLACPSGFGPSTPSAPPSPVSARCCSWSASSRGNMKRT